MKVKNFGIYKSVNYEIFERRESIVIALDGNSPVANLIQEAKNGKGNSNIFINIDVELLEEKANSLTGYVIEFDNNKSIYSLIKEYNREIFMGI